MMLETKFFDNSKLDARMLPEPSMTKTISIAGAEQAEKLKYHNHGNEKLKQGTREKYFKMIDIKVKYGDHDPAIV